MLSLIARAAQSYLPGDPVSMMRRTQHKGRRSAWHEVPHRAMPRFLTDGRTTLDIPTMDAAEREAFKISIALHGLQFITPWITVADGNGRFLSHLELLLTASGDALSAVRWETEYVDEEPPAHVTVHTTWEDALEHDLESALGLLFVVAACLVAYLVRATCRKHGASTLAKLFADDADGDEYRDVDRVRYHHERRGGRHRNYHAQKYD